MPSPPLLRESQRSEEVVGVSASEALAQVMEDEPEAAATSAEVIPLGPGIRIVDGKPMYSAAWLDFEPPRAA
jgi:hypothetical protein